MWDECWIVTPSAIRFGKRNAYFFLARARLLQTEDKRSGRSFYRKLRGYVQNKRFIFMRLQLLENGTYSVHVEIGFNWWIARQVPGLLQRSPKSEKTIF